MLATQEYEMEIQYNSTCRDPIKKGISHPCFYGDIINKAKKLKPDTSTLVKSLKNLICKAMIW